MGLICPLPIAVLIRVKEIICTATKMTCVQELKFEEIITAIRRTDNLVLYSARIFSIKYEKIRLINGSHTSL